MNLKTAYEPYFKVGAAISGKNLGISAHRKLLLSQFNSFTCENDMKPMYFLDTDANRSDPEKYNLSPALCYDRAVPYLEFAKKNGIAMRGHTLVWHNQTPKWFFCENYDESAPFVDRETMLSRMENYIHGVLDFVQSNYPGIIYAWDVVNEAIDEGDFRKSPWTETVGNDFVIKAFEYARKYATPEVSLFYNDYETAQEWKRDLIISNILKPLKERGLVDGMGMQSHLLMDHPDLDLYRTALEMYGALGLQIQITELDMHNNDPGKESMHALAERYRAFFKIYIDAKRSGKANITCVTFWNLRDEDSWLSGFRKETSYPLLFNGKCEAKEAYYAVLEAAEPAGEIDKWAGDYKPSEFMKDHTPEWLDDAVFYEIYPQSFYDTNGDGIGDIPGIIEKLDYIKSLGCNALWINPCYDSPFKDAGYDVRDYKKIAARYGTNEDMYRLFKTAHDKGIRVLLDLVPGHTSEEHEWFRQSGKAEKNEYSDRYIWTDFWICGIAGHPYIGGECKRNGTYMLNFFKCQPALNYGFLNPKEKWQRSFRDPAARATVEALKDIMRFWLDKGCDGFRVDMADSLVKDDDDFKSGTCSIWREIRTMLDENYPEAAMVSEWSNPWQSLNSAGFHMDFYLDHGGNGYNTLLRDYECNKIDRSYFKKNADGDIERFLKDYLPKYEHTKESGYISFMTCNHDTPRARFSLDESELKVAYATLLTLPGVPFIYYGDEIAMPYIADMPTKEGGYTRTGTRTPMQWTNGKNCGFSTADASLLYLPVDENGPSVTESEKRADSLMNVIKQVLSVRHSEASLKAGADFKVLDANKEAPFVFKRGDLVIAVNPREKAAVSECGVKPDGTPVYAIGEAAYDGKIKLGAQSYAIFRAAK